MILGTDSKTAGRRVARYIAGLVLVVLERDGALTPALLEQAVADAFDAHGLGLARAAKRPTAAAATARWVSRACRALADEGFIDTSALGTHWVLEARRNSTGPEPTHAWLASRLGVGSSTVTRWVKQGLMTADKRGLWWAGGDTYFPARAPLPVQAELALDVARKNPVEFAAISPTDDEVRRAEAAAVNMVEPVEAVEPAPAAGRFDVVLLNAGPRKIHAIKAYMDVNSPRPRLREAKDAVESAPVIVRSGVDSVIAKAVRAEFERIGATAKIVKAGEWVPPAPAKPEPAWSVTTFEIARFEVDGVHVVAERGSKRTSVGYEPDEDGFCMDNADPAAVLRYARMLEAAALWALGGES